MTFVEVEYPPRLSLPDITKEFLTPNHATYSECFRLHESYFPRVRADTPIIIHKLLAVIGHCNRKTPCCHPRTSSWQLAEDCHRTSKRANVGLCETDYAKVHVLEAMGLLDSFKLVWALLLEPMGSVTGYTNMDSPLKEAIG